MIAALVLAAALSVTALGVTTLDGRAVDPFDVWRSPRGAREGKPPPAGVWGSPSGLPRALVFVFVQPDCPVSNRYVPELNRLYADYADRGVRIYVVYAGDRHALDAMRSHHAEYAIRVPALADAGLTLAGVAGATVTPEAAVFERGPAGPTLVYRGRIDDRAVRAGVWRPAATARDLDAVLSRLARGEHVAPSNTRAYGCYLRSLSH